MEEEEDWIFLLGLDVEIVIVDADELCRLPTGLGVELVNHG